MQELHQTLMGRKLIEHDIPEIHVQLKRIADALETLVDRHEVKKQKVQRALYGVKMIKHKQGEYTAHYQGDEWRIYRDGVGHIYWWYAEPKHDPSVKAFRADSKNDVIEKMKASYTVIA